MSDKAVKWITQVLELTGFSLLPMQTLTSVDTQVGMMINVFSLNLLLYT